MTRVERDLFETLLEYAEKYADSNDEPIDGVCRKAISEAHALLKNGMQTK